MKLLGSTKSKRTKNKNGGNVSDLEITEVIILPIMIIDKIQEPGIHLLNRSFGQLLDISFWKIIFLKTFDSEFSYIEVWFIGQISKPLCFYTQQFRILEFLSLKFLK